MRCQMSFHSSKDGSHKASMMNKLKEEISKFAELRKLELNNCMIIFLQKLEGFVDCVDNPRSNCHLSIIKDITNF